MRNLTQVELEILDDFCTATGTESMADAMDAYDMDPRSFQDELAPMMDELGLEGDPADLLDAWHERRINRWKSSGTQHFPHFD